MLYLSQIYIFPIVCSILHYWTKHYTVMSLPQEGQLSISSGPVHHSPLLNLITSGFHLFRRVCRMICSRLLSSLIENLKLFSSVHKVQDPKLFIRRLLGMKGPKVQTLTVVCTVDQSCDRWAASLVSSGTAVLLALLLALLLVFFMGHGLTPQPAPWRFSKQLGELVLEISRK